MTSQLVQVEWADDPRLGDYIKLREATLRKHLESERGLFIAEGEKVIRRAIAAGHTPRSFLLAARWLPALQDVIDRHPDVPVYVVTEQMAEEVTGFHVHRGALASLHREESYQESDLLDFRRLVVLEDIVDHTNVGAILRSAAGLGWDGALLAPRSADPLYRRSIKVSMGAAFTLPWARLSDWAAAVPRLQQAGFLTVALSLTSTAIDLHKLQDQLCGSSRKVAILLGTEGSGLSERWTRQADVVTKIPMQAGIDSLNVAAAAAVACWSLAEDHSIRGDTGQSSG